MCGGYGAARYRWRAIDQTFEEVVAAHSMSCAPIAAHAPRGEIAVLIAPPRTGRRRHDDAMWSMAQMSRRDAVQTVAETTGKPPHDPCALMLDGGAVRDQEDKEEKHDTATGAREN